jgi:hypothetical protein
MDALIASASMENGLTQPKSPMYQKGGQAKIEDYIKSGRTYSGDEYNEAYGDYFGDKYGGGDVGLERAESYKYSPNVLQKLLDVIPGVGGKRAYQRAKDYSEQVFNDPEASMRREGEMERGVSAYGRQLSDMVSEDDRTVKDIFMAGSLQQATEDPRNFTYDMGVSDMDKTKINQFMIGSDVGHQVSEGDSKYRSVDPYNIAQSKAGKDLFGIIPMGYSGSVRKNPGIDPQLDVDSLRQQIENMRTADFIPTQQRGGPVNYYQKGGKAEEAVKFRSPLLNKQKYTMTDLMALEAGMPKDEMLVGYDDIRDMDSPRVKALQELAGVLSYDVQSTAESTPEYGFESHIRGKPARSVLGGYSRPGGFDYTIDGIPMIDPVEVRPEYQQGGQMQPRRQKEIRNPEVYGPPTDMMTQMAPDTTGNGLQDMLNQLQMRDVNQSINPFTGDSLDFEGDSLRLLQRMNESRGDTNRTRMPLSPYGRKMQQGGLVGPETYGPPEPTGRQNIEAMQASGMLGQGQPLERRSLMGDANQDSRIAPMPMIEPDQYKIRLIPNAPQDTTMMEIPKLSSAYLASLGVETPLSKRQNSSLQERQIPPQMLNSKVSGLINRALIQRLSKEPL